MEHTNILLASRSLDPHVLLWTCIICFITLLSLDPRVKHPDSLESNAMQLFRQLLWIRESFLSVQKPSSYQHKHIIEYAQQRTCPIGSLVMLTIRIHTYLIKSEALKSFHVVNIHPDNVTRDFLFPEGRSHLRFIAQLQPNEKQLHGKNVHTAIVNDTTLQRTKWHKRASNSVDQEKVEASALLTFVKSMHNNSYLCNPLRS